MSAESGNRLVFPISFTIEEKTPKKVKKRRSEKGAQGFEESQPRQTKSRTNRSPFRRGELYQKIKAEEAKEKAEIKKQLAEVKRNQKAFEKLFSKHTKALISGSALLSNPEGFISNQILNSLKGAGPHAAAIIALITAIAAAPETVKAAIRVLSVKGGPLNDDFRVIVEDIVIGFLSLESQQRRDLGLDSFVISQTDGFQPLAGTDVYNSLLDKDEIRINRVNQDEK